jgi:transcriptional regulator with XRE-family HTH domain
MENQAQDILTILANNIISARTKLGSGQQELAEKAGLPPGQMNSLEQGRKWVSVETLHRLAEALMLEPWIFLSRTRGPLQRQNGETYPNRVRPVSLD